jgi:hypothetical protein
MEDTMRKVIASPFITLDGFIAGPQGELDWATGGGEFDCKSFYSMGGILIIKWAAKQAIGCRKVFALCHKIALSALLAVPGFLRTHPNTCQNSSESAHLIPKFTAHRTKKMKPPFRVTHQGGDHGTKED